MSAGRCSNDVFHRARSCAVDRGIHGRVDTVDGVCDASIRMVEAAGTTVTVGDWVLMSLGLVVDVVDEAEGRALLEQLRELHLAVEP